MIRASITCWVLVRPFQSKLHHMALQVSEAIASSTAHMFIVNPLTGGGLVNLFSTHPAMEERIARLEAMAKDMSYMRS